MNKVIKCFSIVNMLFAFSLLLVFSTFNFADDVKTITFKAEDGLQITADVYISHDLSNPFIILYHQAGWSRGEYNEIAPKLNAMGFNCMAVDQRSGEAVNGVENETYKEAVKKGKATDYISAYEDLKSALEYADKNYAKGKLIVWGSSYSSSLVIKLASDYPELIDGVLAFSPGEYFARLGKSENFISDAAKNVKCPIFITSAKSEKDNWENIYNNITVKTKSSFVPTSAGNHGSRALWERFQDSKSYWSAVKKFLKNYLIK